MPPTSISSRRGAARLAGLAIVFAAVAAAGATPAQAQVSAADAAAALPGFNLVERTLTPVDANHYQVALTGHAFQAGLFRADASSPWHGWIALGGTSGLALGDHSELAGLQIGDAFVVVSGQAAAIPATALPADRQAALQPFLGGGASLTVGRGVNLFVGASVNGGVAQRLLTGLGAPTAVLVTGTVGEGALAAALGKASSAPDATLGRVSIVVPSFAPTAFNGISGFGLTLNRTELWGEKTSSGYALGGSFAASLTAWSKTADVTGTLTVTGATGQRTIAVAGTVTLATPIKTNLLPNLTVKALGLAATFAPSVTSQLAIAVTLGLPNSQGDATGVLLIRKSTTPSRQGVVALVSIDRLDPLKMISGNLPSLQLARTVVMVSTITSPGAITTSSLPLAAAAMFDGLASSITPSAGVRVISQVTVGSGTGPLGNLGGLLSGQYVIEGAVTAAPSLELTVTIPSPPTLPSPIGDYVTPKKVALFVKLEGSKLQAGLRGDLELKLPRKVGTAAPVVTGALAVELGMSGAAVKTLTALKTDWTDCFGLTDITLKSGTGLELVIDTAGAVSVKANGNATIGTLTLGVGGGVSVLLSTGIPTLKGFALRLEASELDLFTPVRLGQTAIRAVQPAWLPEALRSKLAAAQRFDFVTKFADLIPTQAPLVSMTNFKVKGPSTGGNAMIYVMTPGMESDLPDFTDAGVKVKGSLWFGAKRLAEVDAAVTVGGGARIYATSAVPIPVHPLVTIKDPTVDITLNPADPLNAAFSIDGVASMFGLADAGLSVKVTSTSFDGSMTLTFGGIDSASVRMAARVGGAASDLTLSVFVSPAKAIAGIKAAATELLGLSTDAAQHRQAAAAAVRGAQVKLEEALALAARDKRVVQNKLAEAQAELDGLVARDAAIAGRRTDLRTRLDAAWLQLDLQRGFELTADLTALEAEDLAMDALVATARASVSAATTAASYAPLRLHPAVVAAQGVLDTARIGAEVIALHDATRQGALDAVNALSDAAASAVVLQSFELKDASLAAAIAGTPQRFTVVMRVNGKDVTSHPSFTLSTPGSVSLAAVGADLVTGAGGIPSQAQIDARIAKLGLGFGDVRYYKDLARNGTASWAPSKRIGAPGWGEFAVALGGAGGVVYGITFDRNVVKMTDQSRLGGASWAGPTLVKSDWPAEYNHVVVAGGWNGYTGLVFGDNIRIFKDFGQVYSHPWFYGTDPNPPVITRMFGGHDLVYYLTNPAGELWCYRASQSPAGTPVEPGGSDSTPFYWKRIASSGWNDYTQIFGGENGVIYAVDHAGKLIFRHHTGRATCAATWGATDNKQIGSGWDMFQQVIGGEGGVIYGVTRQTVPVGPGATIALYSPAQQRFLRAHGDRDVTDTAGRVPYGRLLPPDWTWEKWRVVDGGNGLVGLWNPHHRRFMRMHSNGTIDLQAPSDPTLQPGWSWERFQIVTAQDPANPAPRGMIRLYNPHFGRYVVLAADGTLRSEAVPSTARTNGYADGVFEASPVSFAPCEAGDPACVTVAEGAWGTWRDVAECPSGTYAQQARQRVEANQDDNDDSALNSLALRCAATPTSTSTVEVVSHPGWWGDWSEWGRCSGSFITGARMKIEANVNGGDNSGGNAVELSCGTGGPLVLGRAGPWGDWSPWQTCPAGKKVCGLSIRLEGQQDGGDDSAMNGLRLTCC